MHRIVYRPDSTWFFLVDVVKLALGIFMGGLMLFFGHEALLAHRLEVAMSHVGTQQLYGSDAINATNAARNQVFAPPQPNQRPAEAISPATQALIDRNNRARQDRKQAAWEAFYQPHPTCKADPNAYGCANAYLAARKQFDSQYQDR